jgi:ATP-binding cassette subfamily B protein
MKYNLTKDKTMILFKFITRKNILHLFYGVVFLSLVISVIPPILSYISRLIFNDLSLLLQGDKLLKNHAINLTIISAIITFILMSLNTYKGFLSEKLNHAFTSNIQNDVYDKYNKISLEELEIPNIHDMVSRVFSHIPNIHNSLLLLISIVSSVISLISCAILIGQIQWYFIIIIIIPNIIYIVAQSKQAFEKYFLELSQSKDLRKIRYLNKILGGREANKEIRAFGILEVLVNKLEKLRTNREKEGQKLLIKQSLISFSLILLSKIGLFICLFIVALKCINGKSMIGDFILVLSSGIILSSSFSDVFGKLNNVNMQFVYLDDWIAFLSMPNENESISMISKLDKIHFDNVSYSYPSNERNALSNVSCTISSGETVALVGNNGSGKSTFISLLLGKFSPKNGSIYINDINLTGVLSDFRKHTACVFQNFAKYMLSVEKNLKLANENFNKDMLNDNSSFINFINDLPKGIDTPLGNIERGSIELSGGEWQRIAIQRALLKDDAYLYILDEPSASLDPIAESNLYKQFTNHLKDKTKIIVSHRLGACSFADKILVFDDGTIIENGSHNELMNIKGKYYEMYNAQRELYKV